MTRNLPTTQAAPISPIVAKHMAAAELRLAEAGIKLPAKSMEPSELDNHKRSVAGMLEMVAVTVSAYGWDDMAKQKRQGLYRNWVNELFQFSIEDIDRAISQLLGGNNPKLAMIPQQVAKVIRADHARRLAMVPRREPEEPARERCDPKVAAEIVRAAGFSGPKLMPGVGK